jgi:hypothetical protein
MLDELDAVSKSEGTVMGSTVGQNNSNLAPFYLDQEGAGTESITKE